VSDDYLSRVWPDADLQRDEDGHINLPPCPDCGQAADDLRVQDTLAMKANIPGRILAVNLDRTMRTISLLPCNHDVREYEIRQIRDQWRVCKLVMATGWKWELGWEGQEITPPGLTPGQTP
jgi:hypothetical protein